MTIESVKQKNCTACHACAGICPKECIAMKADALGFPYPVIDASLCVDCGVCLSACNRAKQIPEIKEDRIFAARSKDKSVVGKSSSGGVFTALSDAMLARGGVIVGAVYDEEMRVHHTFAETAESRDRMRGSKYTYSQCDASVFRRVKELLKAGKTVLFTGTPCQCAGLKSFLGHDDPALCTVDILCHGVESPAIYADYITAMSKHGKVNNIDFRSPRNGNWHICTTDVCYENGACRHGFREQAYFNIFVNDYALRPSCYECRYADFNRVSDITIGDFWGIENTPLRDFDEPGGVSLLKVNTERGAALLDAASDSLYTAEARRENCVHHQLNGLGTPKDTAEFNREYLENGYGYVVEKYGMPPLSIRVKEKLYALPLVGKLRDAAKKAIH